LKLGVGARATAMGSSYFAIANDPTAIYWNPSGLGRIDNYYFLASYNKLYDDMMNSFLGVSIPLGTGSLGIGGVVFSSGKMTRTEALPGGSGYIKGDDFSNLDIAGILSYGVDIYKGTCLGISAKYIRQTLDDKSASGFAMDLGFISRIQMFDIGFTYSNIGSKMKFNVVEYDLPRLIQGGLALHLFEEKAILSFSTIIDDNSNSKMLFGGEYNLTENVSLRAGYRTGLENISGDIKGITAGIGINLSGLLLDYAYNSYGDLGEVHHISLSFKIGSSDLKTPDK
jgi:opacity protein-like surface antigen